MRIVTTVVDEFTYTIEQQRLVLVKSEKDVGFMLDSKLLFEAHMTKKIKKNTCTLFKALVRPHL